MKVTDEKQQEVIDTIDNKPIELIAEEIKKKYI